MRRPTNDLQNLAISASDGAISDTKDLYFDDEAWAIRCHVVETGWWLSSRKVLFSAIAATRTWSPKLLPDSLNWEQLKNSPDIDMPVTRAVLDTPAAGQCCPPHAGYASTGRIVPPEGISRCTAFRTTGHSHLHAEPQAGAERGGLRMDPSKGTS